VGERTTSGEAGLHGRSGGRFRFRLCHRLPGGRREGGLDIDEFCPRISWIFTPHINFIEEVAKFRASIRRLWAKIMKEPLPTAKIPLLDAAFTPRRGRLHASPLQQPLNNLIRTTFQAMAAVLGGCQSLAVCSYDEALALPHGRVRPAFSSNPADHRPVKSGLIDTVDPLGGLTYLEKLPTDIEKRPPRIHRQNRPDRRGGGEAPSRKDTSQQEVQESSYSTSGDRGREARARWECNEIFQVKEPRSRAFSRSTPKSERFR